MTEPPNDQAQSSLPLSDIAEAAIERANQRIHERAERRAEFDQTLPTPSENLVAWVDLLGFSEQITSAVTTEDFREAYRRIHHIHALFDKETASEHSDQAEINAAVGRRVIALSDGLFVAADIEHISSEEEGFGDLYDGAGYFLEGIRLAQALSAVQGNFLRGGIARGLFWFDQDILLSPPLVDAYRMESRIARMPAIIIERELADEIRTGRAEAGYVEDVDPMAKLYRECDWMPDEDRARFVMLDFMQAFLFDGDDPTPHLLRYRQTILEGRSSAQERDLPKYNWLYDYACYFVDEELPNIENMFSGS